MATTRRLTAEEFLKLPEEKPALELVDGMVVQKVSPQEQHSALQTGFAEAVNAFGRLRRVALALPELRGRFGAEVLVPDVAVYRWERLPRTAAGELANVYQGPPDVAVEIVSPEQSIGEMVAKCRRYIAEGVSIALVVDVDHRTVTRLDEHGSQTVLRGDDRIDPNAVLPGFELTVRDLFDTLRVD